MKIKFALIGCGYWGQNYVRLAMNDASIDLIKIFDIDLAVIENISSNHPEIVVENDYLMLVDDSEVQAVVVCTPAETHYEITKSMLLSGKHVLCEKPLTLSNKEAKELGEIALKMNVVLMVAHIFEYHPIVEYINKELKSGVSGDVMVVNLERVGWGIVRADTSVIFDLAAHDVSILLKWINKLPTSVRAIGTKFTSENQSDSAFIQLIFDAGIIANINVSWLFPFKKRLIELVCTKKSYVFDDVLPSQKLKIFESGVAISSEPNSWHNIKQQVNSLVINIPEIENLEPLRTELSHFIDSILTNNKPITGADCALDVISVLAAAEKSLQNNGEVIYLP